MFERKEIGAVRFIYKIKDAKSYYPTTSYFPDIAKEYQIKKIFEGDLFEFTIYSTMGIEFEI